MQRMDVRKLFSTIFVSCFLVGILYTNIFAVDYMVMTSIFNEYYLNNFKGTTLNWIEYIPMLLKVRFIPIVFIVFMAYSKIHKIITLALLGWWGFLWGIYVSLAVISHGIKGVLFSVVGILPQIIFYVPAYFIVLLYCYEYPDTKWNVWKSIAVTFCLISGIVIEGQINPIVLKWFIGIM